MHSRSFINSSVNGRSVIRFASWLATVTFLLGTCAVTLASDNWPQFLGPQGIGHSNATNVPTRWSSEKGIAWKVELPGVGWSSPIVQDARVYLTYSVGGDDGKELELGACCIDANNGKRIWETICFRHAASTLPAIHAKNSHASPTPLLDGDRLFVYFGHLGAACLTTEGKITWKNEELKYPPVHGSGASPILYQNRLIVSCDGAEEPFVGALDAKTGKVAWKTPRAQEAKKYFAFATSSIIHVDGQDQLVSPGADCLMALEPLTGKEIWRVRFSGYSIIPKPLFGNGLIYMSTGYDAPQLLAIRPGGTGDLTKTNIAWSIDRGAPNTPSMLLLKDRIYMVSDKGIITCVDAVKGASIWQQRIGGNFSASPIYAEGRIYFLDEEGKMTVIEPGDTYKELAKNPLGDTTYATPAVIDGAIFIRGESHLYRVGDNPPQ